MGSEVKRIALSGYYGFRNSGDEAVLQSILLALQAEGERQGVPIEPVVLSIRPEETSRMYGVSAVHRMRMGEVARALRECDGLISGGGSLLQDATGLKTIPYYLAVLKMAQFYRKPTFIYAQGIGPVHRPIFYPFIRNVFNKCRYISVRDDESAELLARMGVARSKVEVVPDPVMGLPLKDGAVKRERDSKPVVGVSVRYWNKDRSELDGLARTIRQIAESRPVTIRFLPFHLPDDAEASRYVIDRLGSLPGTSAIEVTETAVHPQDMLAEVSGCDLLIGMRLHSLIYAASQEVPLIGISYDPKIDQFLNRLGIKAAASTSSFESETVATEALRLLDDRAGWKERNQEAIVRLKKQAQLPASQIVAMVGGIR
ncbi:polysaccharide pyruvyl transferase CsaB [Paenibacillus oceani]|uniref:Polysaccharide pyruvyl transferase CsaB n=1 Tax=Paenibacillus oceani TaxID=2772510 RepID=A0A927CBN8_9BACL|nr:polysaccharide pyruvyl transferase CsaB [Paenibacillus oceani]MBD2863617.1 polysaccharide pyruvyl transferase CsaB [Paenibacillus oceani]